MIRFSSDGDSAIMPNPPVSAGSSKRRKRAVIDPSFLEVALFVDKALYDEYVAMYGSTNALAQLNDWLGSLVDMVQILFKLSSLTPKIELKVR